MKATVRLAVAIQLHLSARTSSQIYARSVRIHVVLKDGDTPKACAVPDPPPDRSVRKREALLASGQPAAIDAARHVMHVLCGWPHSEAQHTIMHALKALVRAGNDVDSAEACPSRNKKFNFGIPSPQGI